MDITVTEHDAVVVVALNGRMDATTTGDFDTVTKAHLTQGKHIFVVDMSQLEYISSAGLRSILGLVKAVKVAGGALAFCGLQPMVTEVFRISGFTSMLTICDTKDAALTAVGA